MTVLGKALRAMRYPSIYAGDDASASLFQTPSTVTARGAELFMFPERALHHSTAYACIRNISDDVGNLPIDMVQRKGRWRYPVEDHPLLPFLADDPNDEMDAQEMWRQAVGWMQCRGNGYIYIDYDPRKGKVLGLWPVPATRVWPARDDQHRLMYLLNLQSWDHVGELEPMQGIGVPAEQIMHFRLFGLGLIGLSPIQQMAEAFALSMAAEEYGGRFFEQGALPGGVIKVPAKLTDEQWEIMRTRWDKLHTGQRQAHLTAVLENGADWVTSGVNNAEMQFLELRGFQVEDIARIFGMPLHMVQHTEKATSWGTGLEQQSIAYIIHTLLTPINRIERVVKKRLFPSQRDMSMRMNVAAMLRGDTAARYTAYAIGRQWGWLSVNDIHALENMLPVEGGDTLLSPLNMGILDKDGNVSLPTGIADAPDGGTLGDSAGRARLARLLGDLKAFDSPTAEFAAANQVGAGVPV